MLLNVEKKNALKAYNNADKKVKLLLENLFGKDVFRNQNIMDRIKTVDDAYEETGRPRIDFTFLPADMRKHFSALYDMYVITEALNEGWEPDWDNNDEEKYYSWFVMSPSSFAFDVSYCGRSNALAGSGSRLKFRTRELAEYAAKQFIDIWKYIQIG